MINNLRSEIDHCDNVLTDILCRRFLTAAGIAMYKKENGLKVYQPEREVVVLEKIARMVGDSAYGAEIQELYQHILQISRRIQFKQTLPDNIVLIGFMGSGKSTVGRYLSEITGFTYYDIDSVIEQRTGKSIPEIFDKKGEAYFRALEGEVIESLSDLQSSVISCGGGAVLAEANAISLRKKGKLVWLKAEPETIIARLKHHHDRPLLTNKTFEHIQKMLEKRQPVYGLAADCEVATDGREVTDIGNEIINILSA